jgi:hypothetical protein
LHCMLLCRVVGARCKSYNMTDMVPLKHWVACGRKGLMVSPDGCGRNGLMVNVGTRKVGPQPIEPL